MFTGRRIIEGMKLGASVEVDLVSTRTTGWRCCTLSLDRETTGAGRCARTSAECCGRLHLRDNDGSPIGDRVMLLEDLAALIAREGAHPEALLQLDYKEDAAALTPRAVATFAAGARRRWHGTSSCRRATPRRSAC